MKEKKPTTETYDQWEAWAQQTYRTGGTQPPKSHGGLVAFLLVVIIFLCGISTALGLMNIRLFRQLTAFATEETGPITFSQSDGITRDAPDTPLGFMGQAVPPFWQNYHDLPPGIYVTKVIAGSHAATQGVLPGDVLVAINGSPVTDMETLQQALSENAPGDTVTASFIRREQEVLLTLTLE